MSFLNKLFGSSDSDDGEMTHQDKDPDNTRLIFLLNNWGDNPSTENYSAVLDEILTGNSFLMLPSANNETSTGHWETLEKDKTLQLTSVYNMDGLKVLAAFSDEKSLLEWAKKEIQYTAIKTPDILELCKQDGIDRIVINSDHKNMFVLERNRENISTKRIEKDTQVLVGTPSNPLNKHVIDKLVANFKEVDTVEEAYQYAQSMNGETSIVLGIKMAVVSDNSRAALHNAINDSLNGEELELPVSNMILETEDWLNTVRNIESSLFYKKQG